MSYCLSCGCGKYGATTGLTTSACSGNCAAGYCTSSINTSATANPCTAGYYCSAGSCSATQNICPAGSYCPAGSGSATACPTGTYNASTGQSSCTNCAAGTYNASTGSTSSGACTACAAYTQYSAAGSASCSTCAAGTCNNGTPGATCPIIKYTCASYSANCGTPPDNCGGTLVSCGSCTAPETCGGGGTSYRCGQAGTWGYVDSDGDTYGGGSYGYYTGTVVANDTDCDDVNANVNPGQTAWFEYAISDSSAKNGTFDYNCDGSDTIGGWLPSGYLTSYPSPYAQVCQKLSPDAVITASSGYCGFFYSSNNITYTATTAWDSNCTGGTKVYDTPTATVGQCYASCDCYNGGACARIGDVGYCNSVGTVQPALKYLGGTSWQCGANGCTSLYSCTPATVTPNYHCVGTPPAACGTAIWGGVNRNPVVSCH